MNSSRVEEVSALRAQKRLDRESEAKARETKLAEEANSHAENMARIAKKMARIIKAGNNTVTEEPAAKARVKMRGRPKGSKKRK
jgi:hypothetical protein